MNEKLLLDIPCLHKVMGLQSQAFPQHMPEPAEARTGYNAVFILSSR
jgi:hypothetical protein